MKITQQYMIKKLTFFARKCAMVLGIVLCPVFAMGQQTDAVTLPFAFDGGSADIATTPGMSQEGLGADNAASPRLVFDGTGDYLVIQLEKPATALCFRIRRERNNANDSFGEFDVQTSTDGTKFTNKLRFTNSNKPTTSSAATAETFIDDLGENIRYIRFYYKERTNTSGNISLGEIRLYDRHITVGPTGWTTYFTDESFVMPEGMRGIRVERDSADNSLVKLVTRYRGGMTVPGSVPLLIKAAPGTYSYNRSTEMTNTIGTNHLHGNFFAGTIASVSGADRYYKLANDPEYGIGWYYGAEGGGVFHMSSQKAYLALPQVVSQAPSFEYIEEDFEEETAIEEIPAEGKTEKFFENGQILIKKNGHVYNTVGQQIR